MSVSEPLSERRMAENQVIFRHQNEVKQKWFSRYKLFARKQAGRPTSLESVKSMDLLCECSDENCKKRIKITAADYKKYHKAEDTFTILCGHEVPGIEDVIKETKEYCVVKKHHKPPPTDGNLNPTTVDNV